MYGMGCARATVAVLWMLAVATAAQGQQARWVNVTNPVYAQPGSSAMILCQTNLPLLTCILIGPDGQTFQTQNDIPISPPIGYRQAGSNKNGFCGVQIDRAAERDNGNWSCSAIPQGALQLTADIAVYVLKKPQSIQFTQKGPLEVTNLDNKREKAHIGCVVYGGRPPANLSWYIDDFQVIGRDRLSEVENIPLPDNQGYQTTQNFTGYFIADDNERRLKCVASHPAFRPGDINSTQVEVLVNFPPQAWNDPNTIKYGFINGQMGTIKANVSANPVPSVVWTLPNGEQLKNRAISQDKRISSNRPQSKGHSIFEMQLILDPVEEGDVNGQFQMDVTNEYGSRTYFVRISSEAAPPQGLNCIHNHFAGLAAGAIVGIVIGIPAFLLIIALLVFARATGRWCFKARDVNKGQSSSQAKIGADLPPPDAEGTDNPSANQTAVDEKQDLPDSDSTVNVNGTTDVKQMPTPKDSPV